MDGREEGVTGMEPMLTQKGMLKNEVCDLIGVSAEEVDAEEQD